MWLVSVLSPIYYLHIEIKVLVSLRFNPFTVVSSQNKTSLGLGHRSIETNTNSGECSSLVWLQPLDPSHSSLKRTTLLLLRLLRFTLHPQNSLINSHNFSLNYKRKPIKIFVHQFLLPHWKKLHFIRTRLMRHRSCTLEVTCK